MNIEQQLFKQNVFNIFNALIINSSSYNSSADEYYDKAIKIASKLNKKVNESDTYQSLSNQSLTQNLNKPDKSRPNIITKYVDL
jgi:hypothetical protein